MTSHERSSTAFDRVLWQRLDRRRLVRQTSALGLSLPSVSGLAAVAAVPGKKPYAASAAQSPQGELIVGIPADQFTTDPDLWTSGIGMYPSSMNIFEPLVTMTSDYALVPVLAETWEMVDDTTWRLTLRDDVVFHDGTPLTSEAMHSWLERLERIGLAPYLGIAEVVVIDEHTFEFKTAEPSPRLMETLAANYQFVEAPGSDLTQERIGTGPFRDVEYAPHDHYTVEAFDGYWGQPAKLERIAFRFLPDPTTRVLALQAGEIHIAADIPRESVPQVEAGDGLLVVPAPPGGYVALMVGSGEEPYDLTRERAVREAVAYGIDKQAIIDGVWLGNAEMGPTMVPAAMLGEHAALVQGPAFDQEHARQVLDTAGWAVGGDGIRMKDGRALVVTLVNGYPTPEDHGAMPELVQAQLREIGIDAQIVQTSDIGSYDARTQGKEGNLWAETSTQYNANPCSLPHEFFIVYEPYTALYAPSEETVAAIERCIAAPTRDEAAAAIAEAMHILVDEEYVVIPLAATYDIYGVADTVEGFAPHSVVGLQYWNGVSLAG